MMFHISNNLFYICNEFITTLLQAEILVHFGASLQPIKNDSLGSACGMPSAYGFELQLKRNYLFPFGTHSLC